MRIVQINTTYNEGSIGRTTAELHERLIAQGDSSFVFTSTVEDKGNHIYCIGNSVDHKIHGFLSKLFGLQAYFSHIPTRKLLRRLYEIKPDVVHLRNLHANYVNLPMLLRFLAENDIATVLTLHDCWFITGKCCYYTHVNCERFISGCHDCPALSFDNSSWFFDTSQKVWKDKKKLFQDIHRLAVVGNSEWTTEQARKSYLHNSAILTRVYNWIDMEQFYARETDELRSSLKLRKDDFVILGVSQGWSKRKGLDIFISLAQKLPSIKVILVGIVSDAGELPSNILSVGPIKQVNELCKYYSLADVFINPSLQETFGKVSAEALCCGTPIIVNNATANPELVGEGCGYVINNNNIDEYVTCIKKIIKSGKSHYTPKCIAFAKENFDKETNIKAYINIYHELINK